MGQKEIDALQERVAGEEAEAPEGVEVSEEDAKAHFGMEDGPAAPASAELATAISAAVLMLGGAICAAAAVTPLDQAEADQLGQAAADVARHYPGLEISPKAGAWLGLGMTALAVAAPRIAEHAARTAPQGGSQARQDGEPLADGPEGPPDAPAPLDAPQSPYKQ